MSRYAGKVNAPDFPQGLDWINTAGPLSMKQLRGKVVLLDFWTYCCINCMHIIPDLRRLEEKYAAELVVVGVHSAKFLSERETENILPAVLRYEIEHPVVNDRSMNLWRQYGVRAWPTVVLVDPEGKVVGALAGEGVFERLDPMIQEVVAEFDAAGRLDRAPFRMHPVAERMPQTTLSFPGKVLADAASGRLFIADSNHNRILVCTLGGEVKDVITASFKHPQGMCLVGDTLYIADTGNNALRRANLVTGTVETAAEGLNSPWDVVAAGGAVYIAMAGAHQVWRYDPSTNAIGPYAGSSREEIIDGPLREAALAQPSGITTDGRRLYFVDSETSSVRSASLDLKGNVETIVGHGLFEFGDTDGRGDEVRLQHPLGITMHDSVLYVADTYNNKIKKVLPGDRTVTTLAAGFDEPGGLSFADGKLYVADTNNHIIQVVDLSTGKIEPLVLRGVDKLKPHSEKWAGESADIHGIVVAPGEIEVIVAVSLPAEYKLNEEAPSRILVRFEDGREPFLVPGIASLPIRFNATVNRDVTLRLFGEFYYCGVGREALCFYKEILLTIPIKVSPDMRQSVLRIEHMLGSADLLA